MGLLILAFSHEFLFIRIIQKEFKNRESTDNNNKRIFDEENDESHNEDINKKLLKREDNKYEDAMSY